MGGAGVSNNLATLRQQQGLTKAQLAKKAGVCPRTIWRAENGCTPHAYIQWRIAKALGLPWTRRGEVFPG
jgi:transcriptional regulator with XRE-family HTH domain